MRSYHILAAGFVCCFLACQKEPDDAFLIPTGCKLDEIHYFDANVPYDTVGLEYSGDRVSKANYADHEISLVYSGNLVVKRNYYNPGSSVVGAYEDFIYNPDSTLGRVDFFVNDPGFPAPVLIIQYSFSYVGGKLSLLEAKLDTSGTGPVPLVEYHYEHTGNNITRLIGRDLINQSSDTINYSFDATINYYSKNPALWLTDQLFAEFNGVLLPLALSANNVTSLFFNDGSATQFTYTETDKAEIESIRIDGDLAARYKYKCQ